MKAKELVGATLIGVSAIAVGCVITTEKPADSSPPPTPPPPAPVAAPVASAPAPTPAPTPAPVPVVEAPDAAAPAPMADGAAAVDAGPAAAPAAPKKHGLGNRKPDGTAADGGS